MMLAEAEQEEARRARAVAKREVERLHREAAAREREATRSHALRSKGRVGRKDFDAKDKINRARITNKDGQAGKALRQLDGRVEQARKKLSSTRVKKRRELGIDLQADRAQRDFLLRLGHGELPLGTHRRLVYPKLEIRPGDRIALVGPNGGGKSTLIRHLVEHLDLPAEKLVYMAQEISAEQGRMIVSNARQLPPDRLGEVMSVVSCLGSEPTRLLETEEPSPGELRKLLLALGIERRPWLIIMDEPTNHLDLPSIECIEAALAECPSALLLVSHDRRFLHALTKTRWEVAADREPGGTMRLEVSGET
jgi:ATPase subunit of ABC transporter with duplicated ATPase domains